ncbi:MAG: glycine--tRNA ligase [Planctomycetota bacterium]|nr:glycine--tRNA ligase [Planctomycetota bacterium]
MEGLVPPDSTKIDKIVSLCKRRGYVFPSSEIYGGLSSSWDYGPLGVELKRNVREAWWHSMVTARQDVVGLDAAILMHPKVWEASGHISGFQDPLVDCKKCKRRFKADGPEVKDRKDCPECGGDLTDARMFNLMFSTEMGVIEGETSTVYLRPETAQGIFVNYVTVQKAARLKLPFGIAQIGKAFRNEITPGNFIFRTREFEQMELEYFVKPSEADRHFEPWVQERYNWYLKLGISPDRLRLRPHGESELAHYASACTDIEYEFPFGWSELEGIANRGDYDLLKHQESSGKDLTYFDDQEKRRYLPHVIEPSAGVDRSVLTFLADAYDEEEGDEIRVVLRLHPALAPIKVAIFPLVKKDGMPERAREIEKALRPAMAVFYDAGGAIGRRYRRQDEAGTPYCVTVDGQTTDDDTVTLRDRDSMKQERIHTGELLPVIQERISAWKRPGE